MAHLFQLFASGIGLGVDIMNLLKDFSGWDFGSALRWFADVISIAGDLAALLGGIAALVQNSTLQTIADGISYFVNMAAGIYKAATSSWWGMGMLMAGYYSVKAFFSEEDIGLQAEEALSNVASSFTKSDILTAGASVGLSFVLSVVSYYTWQNDIVSNESVSQFCQANPNACK